ncbi:ROK family protein [Pseudactinotalea sp. HY160]|nr:ROK family protein [Pseudactinotalea sp. HY160]
MPGPVAAFDVGGTDIKAGLVHPDGSISHRSTTPTPRDPARPAAAVVDRTTQLAAAMPGAVALGVVVPGLVDDVRGVGVYSANLGWRDAPFGELLAAATDLPVGFNHDVTAAAIAETTFGAAAGIADAAVVAIGTGIAAGLIVDGRPHRARGYAGELGHTVVDPSGPLCPCGARGCLEAIASAAALARRYTEVSGRPAAGAREVLAARAAGDETAARIWQEGIRALAAGLRQLSALLAPEIVVIGGGLMRAGDDLFTPLRREAERTFTVHPVPPIVAATTGPDAGLLGSALIGAGALTGDAA